MLSVARVLPVTNLSVCMRTMRNFAVGRRRISDGTADELLVRRCDGEHEGVIELAMNRPQARNALSKNLVNRMEETLAEIQFDNSVRALVLRSANAGIFCAGADLKERAKMTPEEVGPFVSKLRRLVSSFADLPVPVIAAIDGAALGGGLEIALACDMRIASEDAKMGLVETKLAIIPGAGGTQRLPRIVGPAIAKEMIFTAKIIQGSEAKEVALVNSVVVQNKNGDAAACAALEMAKKVVPNGPFGVKMAKIAISKGIETTLETGLAIEQACYAQVIPTEDRIEGLAAFREKRTPQYKGK